MTLILDTRCRFCFAAGGAATGLIGNGVAFFLLIYYSQVCGLSPTLAGLALLIALMVDAISDPVIGKWSDNYRSLLGRRHPFMYASIMPVAAFYYALWVPPETSQTGLFAYLLAMSVGLRISLTAFSVPFSALIPELTPDYDKRTRLLNDNVSSGWFVGILMAVAMYAYWMADTPEYPDGSGILRAAGYRESGLVNAVLILVLLTIAVRGTHRYVPQLLTTTQSTYRGFGEMLRQIGETFTDRSFRAMAIAGILNATGAGTSTALWAYMQPYFWGFNSGQISLLLASQLLSALLAFGLLPVLSNGREKKVVLIYLSLLLAVVSIGPVALRLLGLFPENGTSGLFTLMLILGVLNVALIISVTIVTGSMLSDIVESRALVSGRREEGTLLAVQSFITKVATGLGTFFGGVILSVIQFPDQTQGVSVTPDVVFRLGLVYAPALATFYIAAIIALRYYRITRQSHRQAVEQLAALN